MTDRDITDALIAGVRQALYECSGGDFEATPKEAHAIAERLADEFADANALDCRTCRHYRCAEYECMSVVRCINWSMYSPTTRVYVGETT